MSRRVPVVALVVSLLGALVAPAAAQQTPSPEARADRISDLETAIGEASAEEAAALRELSGIRNRRVELDASLTALAGEIGAVEAAVAARQADVDRLASEVADLDRRITVTTGRLERATERAEESAADLYVNESGGAPVQLGALEADELRDVFVGSVYLAHVSNDRWQRVDELAGLKETIEQLEAAAERQRAEADAARVEAENRRQELGALRTRQQRERDEIAKDESRERALIESIRERRDEFTAELATLQVSSNAITDLLLSRQRGQTRTLSFALARPVPGGVTSGFGTRVHPVLGDTRTHNGIDMSAGYGSPINAAAGGVVAFAGVRSGYGNTVIIDHGNQYATLYAHASTLLVGAGERVGEGETIAKVGATGLATGPHLHFEVRLLGTPVNPLNYLD
jgi:murein DD-endopeptidase MepM/ murein hydrolase activator NlpD